MRSSKPGSDEMAAAFCTLSGPEFSPWMLTGNQPAGQFVVCVDSVSAIDGGLSGGTHIGSIPLRMLFCTFLFSETAVASTYGFKDEPTCPLFFMAMFSWA